jgi:hypothetical protein
MEGSRGMRLLLLLEGARGVCWVPPNSHEQTAARASTTHSARLNMTHGEHGVVLQAADTDADASSTQHAAATLCDTKSLCPNTQTGTHAWHESVMQKIQQINKEKGWVELEDWQLQMFDSPHLT